MPFLAYIRTAPKGLKSYYGSIMFITIMGEKNDK